MLASLKDEFLRHGSIQLTARVVPGTAKTRVMKVMDDGSVKIAVAAPAEQGKANVELVRFLAKEFDVTKENVEIVAGKTARMKLVRIRGSGSGLSC